MNIDRKIGKLIFCDKVPVVAEGGDVLYIAMNPVVYSNLLKRRVWVHNTLPYFTNESHEKSLEKSKILADWIRTNSKFIDPGTGIKNAYKEIFMFWLRFAIHYNLFTIEIILNAIAKHCPKEISVYSFDNRHVSSNYIEAEEGYLSLIVEGIAKKNDLVFRKLSDGSKKRRKPSKISFKNMKAFVVEVLKFKLKTKYRLGDMSDLENPVILTSKSYHMDEVANTLNKQSPNQSFYFLKYPIMPAQKIPSFLFSFLFMRHSKLIFTQERLLDDLASEIEKQEELFSFGGISFDKMLAKKIRSNYINFISELMFWSILLEKQIEKLKPKMVISNASRFDDMLIAELCHKKKIPSLLISHGSHVRPKNEYEKIEWGEHGKQFFSALFSNIAMPTPSSEGYLDVFSSSASIIKTGPLLWGTPVNLESGERIFKELFNGKYTFGQTKVVMHVGTPKASNSLRPYIYETMDEYIQAICDLARSVEKNPKTVLVIKFRPSKELSTDALKRLVPLSDKVVLCVDSPLRDVLGMADLLVSFSSTATDEALQNRIPLFLYGGGGRYQHLPAYEIKSDSSVEPSAIYHAKESKNLREAVSKIIDFDIKNDYNDLFDQYIYPRKDRRSLAELF